MPDPTLDNIILGPFPGPGSGGTSGPATQITETSGPTTLTIGAIADGQYAQRVGTTLVGGSPSGSGTVTSVAMTVPTFLSIAGSPITGSGTLAVTLSGTALPVANGGTGGTTAATARTALSAAASGANSDITSLTALSTPLSVTQGGTGSGTAAGARTNLGAAASGANADITSLTGLTGFTDGQLYIGNTVTGGVTKTTITAGANATVTNGNGSITIAFTGSGGSGFPVSTATYAVQDNSDTTKQQLWNLASATTGTNLTLKGQQSTSQTLAFPNIAGADTVATLGLGNAFTAANTFGTATMPLAITGGIQNAVSPATAFQYTGGAHTLRTAGTVGLPEIIFDLSQTKQWTGNTAVNNYKAIQIKPPVLSSDTATLAFGTACTLCIEGPPTAGANATASGTIALLINAGNMTLNAGTLTCKGTPANVNITQSNASSGVSQSFLLTGGSLTNQTASTEITSVYFNLGQTIQHATGTLATNRSILIAAPTHSFVGASALTDCATVAITGAPAAGTNATFTNTPSALWVQAGQIRSDGNFRATPAAAPSALQEGMFWTDSTRQAMAIRAGLATQISSTVLFTSTADATVANTTVEGSVIGTGVGTMTLPANFLVAGKMVRMSVRGILSNAALATLRVRVFYGATVLLDSTATGILGTNTNTFFMVTSQFICRTTGASGTVMPTGNLTYNNSTTSQANGLVVTAPVTVDTTSSALLDIKVTLSASATNSVTGQSVVLEVLN